MTYPAKKRYDAKNLVRYSLVLNRNTDAELIEHMERQESKNGYLKKLIRDDLQREEEQE